MSNWADLQTVLLLQIADLFVFAEDFKSLVAFGGVCCSWRSVYLELKARIINSPPLHFFWVMHSNSVNKCLKKDVWIMNVGAFNDPDYTDRCYCLSLNYNFKFVDEQQSNNLPPVKHYIKLPDVKNKMCYVLEEGWLLTVSDVDLEASLVNLLSGVQIGLPNFNTIAESPLVELDFYSGLKRVLLTQNPSDCSDFLVLMCFYVGAIAIARPGDFSWKLITKHRASSSRAIEDIVIYKGKVLTLCDDGIWCCDINGDPADYESLWSQLLSRDDLFDFVLQLTGYLVESSGDLLALVRNSSWNSCTVYLLDFEDKKWMKVSTLGGRSIFVGLDKVISFEPSEICVCSRPNCIYFIKRYLSECNIRMYDLSNESLTNQFSFYPDHLRSLEFLFDFELAMECISKIDFSVLDWIE